MTNDNELAQRPFAACFLTRGHLENRAGRKHALQAPFRFYGNDGTKFPKNCPAVRSDFNDCRHSTIGVKKILYQAEELSALGSSACSRPAIAESTRQGNRKKISMNPLIQLKKAAPVFLAALVCFGLLPNAQAVSPPPDGGYPGFTTAEGQHALKNNLRKRVLRLFHQLSVLRFPVRSRTFHHNWAVGWRYQQGG